MKFVNREPELLFLQDHYRQKGAKLIPVYGRRRVGKTRLIREFIKDKPHIYYLCEQTSGKDQLREISSRIGEFFAEPLLINRPFSSWGELFEFLGRQKKKYVFVFDEYPYLCMANKGISSLFQKGWDLYLNNSNVFLMLSGSSIGMMEREVLFYKAPLYGRRTGQVQLNPFSFVQTSIFFPRKKVNELVEIYTLLGGIPAYLLQYDSNLNLWQNIETNILKPESYLAKEPEFIIREELREPRTYLTLLKAIADGKRKFGDIANASGLTKTSLPKYLHVLESLRFIEREVPVTEKLPEKSKKGLYRLQDNFFNFYFSLVFPFRSDLEKGSIDFVLQDKIRPRFDFLVSFVFEDICAEWVLQGLQKLPQFDRVGRFWDKDTEIDLVALNEKHKEILFAECKWSRRPVGENIYNALLQKKQQVLWNKDNRKEYFALFAKSGFTLQLKKLAEKKANLFLFTLKSIKSYF
jgi:AAA+ ATPase superfamily predicted ATPase